MKLLFNGSLHELSLAVEYGDMGVFMAESGLVGACPRLVALVDENRCGTETVIQGDAGEQDAGFLAVAAGVESETGNNLPMQIGLGQAYRMGTGSFPRGHGFDFAAGQ